MTGLPLRRARLAGEGIVGTKRPKKRRPDPVATAHPLVDKQGDDLSCFELAGQGSGAAAFGQGDKADSAPGFFDKPVEKRFVFQGFPDGDDRLSEFVGEKTGQLPVTEVG